MCEPKAVRLYKIAKPPGILRGSLPVLVSGTELASKYESSVLIATISVSFIVSKNGVESLNWKERHCVASKG